MAFMNAQNTVLNACSFTDIQGDSNTFNGPVSLSNGADPGLAELLKLISPGAAYDSEERHPPPRCHPNTRTLIIDKIMGWIDAGLDETHERVLWLHGPAGVGKSAIAQTICERSAERGDLAASFFFSRGARDVSAQLFTTIAFHLAMSIPGQRIRVCNAIDKNSMVLHRTTSVQVQSLIIETLQLALAEPHHLHTKRIPFLVVIDGLDECKGNDSHTEILAQILELVKIPSICLRFVVLSRPEPHIQHSFSHTDLKSFAVPISLYDDPHSFEDVRTYLVAEFERIYVSERHSAALWGVPRPFPSGDTLALLVDRSGGYFIYASTIIRYVDEEYFSPVERLGEVVHATSSGSGAFRELDNLYRQVLSRGTNSSLLKKILGFILAPRNKVGGSLPGWFITKALNIQRNELLLTLRGLHSIFSNNISNDQIFPFHESLHDFIFHPDRAGNFYVELRSNHAMITRAYLRCLETWCHSPPPNELGAHVVEDLLFHFSEAQTHPDDTIRTLIATPAHVWEAPFWALATPIHLRVTPEAASDDWLLRAIRTFEILDPPSPALTQHFSSLLRIALRCMCAWASAFGVNWSRTLKGRGRQMFAARLRMTDLRTGSGAGSELQILHTRLAWQCMRVLKFPMDDLQAVRYWKKRYAYSRAMWAGHVSRASPGDAELLYQLRLVDMSSFKEPAFLKIEEENNEDESEGQSLRKFGFDISVTRILDVFDSRGLYEKPIDLEGLLRQFRRVDWVNAELILQWLSKMSEPPEDLVSCWASYYEQLRDVLDREDQECQQSMFAATQTNHTFDEESRGGDTEALEGGAEKPTSVFAHEAGTAPLATIKRLRSLSTVEPDGMKKKRREQEN